MAARIVDAPWLTQLQPLGQDGGRYRWDGEETYGMLERSYPLDRIDRSLVTALAESG